MASPGRRLPLEIVGIVIQQACSRSSIELPISRQLLANVITREARRQLVAFCTVSTSCLEIARPLLFEFVHPDVHNMRQAMVDFMVHGPVAHLAMIRELSISLGPDNGDASVRSMADASLFHFIKRLSNVRSLHLSTSSISQQAWPRAYSALRLLRVETLVIEFPEDGTDNGLAATHFMKFNKRHLKRLLCFGRRTLGRNVLEGLSQYPALRHLSIGNGMGLLRGPIAAYPQRLSHLHLDLEFGSSGNGEEDEGAGAAILRACSETIRTLSLGSHDASDFFAASAGLSLPALKTIYTPDFSYEDNDVNPSTALDWLDSIEAPSLLTLGIPMDQRFLLQFVIALGEGRLQSIRHVGIGENGSAADYDVGTVLAPFLKARGIAMTRSCWYEEPPPRL